MNELLAYQEVDKKLKDVENVLNQSEEKKQSVVAYLFLKQTPDAIAKLDGKAESLEAAFNALGERQKKLNETVAEIAGALESAEDATETDYLFKKADELTAGLKAVESELNKVSMEVADVKKEYDQIRKQYGEKQKQYNENMVKYKALEESKAPEKNAVLKELADLEKTVKPEFMELYKKKRAEKVFPILYPAEESKSGGRCGYCGMELSMKNMSDLGDGKLVECDSCHRLVYKK